jgi:hypothetical protein
VVYRSPLPEVEEFLKRQAEQKTGGPDSEELPEAAAIVA